VDKYSRKFFRVLKRLKKFFEWAIFNFLSNINRDSKLLLAPDRHTDREPYTYRRQLKPHYNGTKKCDYCYRHVVTDAKLQKCTVGQVTQPAH